MVEKPDYDYEPIVEREFALPDDRNLAVLIVPNVEHFEYGVPYPSDDIDRVPDVKGFSSREYGTRVGIWRLLDVLDGHDVTPTAALNAAVCDREPEIVEALAERGWELMGHGVTNSRRLTGMDEREERETIRETRRRIAEFAGTAPTGWLSPGLAETEATLPLLAEEGYGYVCDWCNDEQPYPIRTGAGTLIALPYSLRTNDKRLLARRGMTGPEYRDALVHTAERLHADGERTPRVMAIALHQHLSGDPRVSGFLDEALARIADLPDVWLTTGGELAARYREEYLPPSED